MTAMFRKLLTKKCINNLGVKNADFLQVKAGYIKLARIYFFRISKEDYLNVSSYSLTPLPFASSHWWHTDSIPPPHTPFLQNSVFL